MMRGLIPFDPSRFYLGITRRTRRKLHACYSLKQVANPEIEYIEGIPVESLKNAIVDARESGAVDLDRLEELEKMI